MMSSNTEDPAWDAFVAASPSGQHVQTALWARVKASIGWDAVRLVMWAEGRIIGGGQLLARSVPILGGVGYVPKGPVTAEGHATLGPVLVDELMKLSRERRIRHVTIQPPDLCRDLERDLADRGFRRSSFPVGPTSSLVIDLQDDAETILASMSPKTRYNIRVGSRKGIVVREGGESDISSYYELLVETSRRQGFGVYPESYYRQMWRVFSPAGAIKLFMAEYDGEAVSGQILIPFGDTVVNKMAAWSGRHGSLRPNEAIQWHAIAWSKEHGYRRYDFEGLSKFAVHALQRAEPLPDELRQTVASFKAGFGGEPVLFADAWYHIANPVVRKTYAALLPRIGRWQVFANGVSRLRFRSGRAQHD